MNQEQPRHYETLEDYELERNRLLDIAEDARAAGDIKKAEIAERGALEMAMRISRERARREREETKPIPKVEIPTQDVDYNGADRSEVQKIKIKDILEAMQKQKEKDAKK